MSYGYPDDYSAEDENDRPRRYREVPTYLAQSILVTLFCCIPFGIVAIVNAAQVSGHVASGNYRAAQAASDRAKLWSTLSAVSGFIVIVAYVALVASGAIKDDGP